jgi:hypothetical protein
MEFVRSLPYDHPFRWDATPVGGSKLWRPDELGADLALWLDAEDAASITLNGTDVAQWDDKSGNGNDASQATAANQPAYVATGFNSKPSIDFVGSSEQLTTSYVLDFPFSISAAVQNDIASGNVRGAVGSGTRRPALGILTAAPAQNAFALWNPDLDRGAYINNTQTTVPVILYSDAASDDRLGWNIYVDGSNAGQANENVSTLNPADIVRIGYTGSGSEYWNGDISEVVIASQSLSTSDRQKLEGYLAWHWELEANLPVGHPYASTPPIVAAQVDDAPIFLFFRKKPWRP